MILTQLITLRAHKSIVKVIDEKMSKKTSGKKSKKVKNSKVAQKINITHLLNS